VFIAAHESRYFLLLAPEFPTRCGVCECVASPRGSCFCVGARGRETILRAREAEFGVAGREAGGSSGGGKSAWESRP
jgi:hypothetical protein